jgi:hypothetical protein
MNPIDEIIRRAAEEGEVELRDDALRRYGNRLRNFGTINDHAFNLNEIGWKHYNKMKGENPENIHITNNIVNNNTKGLVNLTDTKIGTKEETKEKQSFISKLLSWISIFKK